MIYIETPRLRLRDWEEQDLPPFRRMNAEDEVMRYFPKKLTPEESDDFNRAIQAELKECGFGLYAVEEKERNEFIGFVGFHKATFEAEFTPCVEIGWRLKREAWGKGFATEAAMACLQYGFTELGFQDVYSFTSDINEPSKNVMKKIGLTFKQTFDHPKIQEEGPLRKHVLFHIHRDVLSKEGSE
ncbi:GNAT family N-acetyltransferase [Sporosarcina sp. Te-1]|uniref:GNAT family N-acetyltransferase n=1 Tax=Sporosarcina sp. Te-1 TaxID=2818390 RepID=UPI001A9DE260|nr:GNAT family N-acetyltransferase [Sporosarcina sp. Te-1]QTD41844.1 GNAT family N-acetyltransferase [Sporosarcina sp. Te-1]